MRRYVLDQKTTFGRLLRAEIDAALSYDPNFSPDLDFAPLRTLPPTQWWPYPICLRT